MSVQLLDKTRKIKRLLNNNTDYRVHVNDLCGLVGEMLYSNVVTLSSDGKIIGLYENVDIPNVGYVKGQGLLAEIDAELNERFMSVLSTKENVNLGMLGIIDDASEFCDAMIIPIDISGERLGTVFIYRLNNVYEIDDIILGEYIATIIAIEMLEDLHDAALADADKEKMFKNAIKSLSSSEQHAIVCVLMEMPEGAGNGLLNISSLASQYNITRSAIINALKKLNSAGVIQSRSMGVKGTWITVRNQHIYELLLRKEDYI